MKEERSEVRNIRFGSFWRDLGREDESKRFDIPHSPYNEAGAD